MSAPTTRRISATSAAVAPPEANPVEVFDEISPSRLRQRAGGDLLVIGEQRRFDDDLAVDAALTARFDDGFDIALHGAQIAGLQRADIDHHVDFGGAVEDRPPGFEVLDVGGRRPERKPDDGTDADAAAPQQARRGRQPRWD